MKLTLIGHDDRYAVEQLMMSLFPDSAEGEATSTLHRGGAGARSPRMPSGGGKQ